MLVHGLATTRRIWGRVVPLLQAERRVVAIDVPGFGASPPAGPGFELDEVAAAIDAGLERAGVPRPFDLVGHSMGGAVGLALATRRPESVRALVLAAPAGLQPLPPVAATALGLAGSALVALRRAGAPLAANPWGRRLLLVGGSVDGARFTAEQVRQLVGASGGATRVRAALTAVAATDLREAAATLPMPLGVIRGARDPVFGAAAAAAMAACRPGLAVTTLDDAGHIAMAERPGAFAAALVELLARLR